jgi:hypothetical protein
MSRFQQGSLLKLKRKSGPDVWVFRWYDESSGTRTYKKRTLGTVTEIPLRRDAEKAVADFRANINVEVRVPVTVSELIAHYRKHELTPDRKAFATIESDQPHRSEVGREVVVRCTHRGSRRVVAFSPFCSGNKEQNPQHHVGGLQSCHPV